MVSGAPISSDFTQLYGLNLHGFSEPISKGDYAIVLAKHLFEGGPTKRNHSMFYFWSTPNC